MTRRLLTGLSGLMLLTAALVGLPTFLIAVQHGLAGIMPSLADVPGALLAPGDGGLFLMTLLGIGWICWLVFTLAFAVEMVARVRGVRAPRLGPFLPQRSAAWAITAVTLLATLTSNGGSSAQAAPSTVVAASANASAAQSLLAGGGALATHPGQPGLEDAAEEVGDGVHWRDYRVRRGDTLWDIAGRELDDPRAWPRIEQASEQIPQPDGRHLEDPDLILPGWTLHVPQSGSADRTPTARTREGTSPDVADDGSVGTPTTPPPAHLPATPLRPPTPERDAAALAASPEAAGMPNTPLSGGPRRRSEDGIVLAAAETTTTSAGVGHETHRSTSPAFAMGDLSVSHSIPGLPAWILPPAKPTQLTDHAATRSLVLAVLAEQRGR